MLVVEYDAHTNTNTATPRALMSRSFTVSVSFLIQAGRRHGPDLLSAFSFSPLSLSPYNLTSRIDHPFFNQFLLTDLVSTFSSHFPISNV